MGYNSPLLPQIEWTTQGTAVITTRLTTLAPNSYVPIMHGKIVVHLADGLKSAPKSVYVLRIDKASALASQCSVLEPFPVVNAGDFETEPTPQPTPGRGSSSTTTTKVPDAKVPPI